MALARLARLSVPARPSESPRDCLSSPGLSTVRGSCSVGQADAVTLDQVGDGAADGLAVLVLELDVLLAPAGQLGGEDVAVEEADGNAAALDRKSDVWGKSVSVRVDIGGSRIIKKKKQKNENI